MEENDILISKVARMNNQVYFYVKTKDNISSPENKNWMLLFIGFPIKTKTNWLGKDMIYDQPRCNRKMEPNTIKKSIQKKGWKTIAANNTISLKGNSN